MKFIAFTALVASVSAEAGVTCSTDATWTAGDLATGTDAATCKTACETEAKAATTKDYCCSGVTTPKTDTTPAAYACKSYQKDADPTKDGRVTGTATQEAWYWCKGVEQGNFIKEASAKDSAKDSAKMITTVIATFAAMVIVA